MKDESVLFAKCSNIMQLHYMESVFSFFKKRTDKSINQSIK